MCHELLSFENWVVDETLKIKKHHSSYFDDQKKNSQNHWKMVPKTVKNAVFSIIVSQLEFKNIFNHLMQKKKSNKYAFYK